MCISRRQYGSNLNETKQQFKVIIPADSNIHESNFLLEIIFFIQNVVQTVLTHDNDDKISVYLSIYLAYIPLTED